MSTIVLGRLPPELPGRPPLLTMLDKRRSTAGVWLFILTEGVLFVLLFVSYFYLPFIFPKESGTGPDRRF